MGCASSHAAEEEEKYGMLACSPFFLHLTSTQLHAFTSHFRFAYFSAGSIIFEQGEAGGEFYLVGEGECDITLKEDGNEQPKFLCSKKKGDIFGEKGVLEEDACRSATVTATEDCTLLLLTRIEFQLFMSTLDLESQGRMRNVMGTKMLDSLREIDFLRELDDMRLGLLANVFRYVTIEAGEVVFSEGDLGRDLYIISDGTVSVSAKSGAPAAEAHPETDEHDAARQASRASFIAAPSAIAALPAERDGVDSISRAAAAADPIAPTDVQFATLSTSQYFGELSLMVDMPRTATVRAITRCLLLVLNIADFSNFVKIVPNLQHKFTTLASARIAQQFRKFNVPFFQSIHEDRFIALSNLCKLESFEKDAIIFREGEIPQPNMPAFYLVVSGRLVATKMDVGVVATLLPPSYIGEISLVTDSPRTATIIADTRCVLLSLTKEAFHSFFLDSHDGGREDGYRQYAEFSIKLSQRQVPLKPVLGHTLGHKLFGQHLALEYSTENIDFYDDSIAFEALFQHNNNDDPNSPPAAAAAAGRDSVSLTPKQLHIAEEIIYKYIRSDAETQVNIPSGIREACLQEYERGQISWNMFQPARHEIFKLMSADSFKRFKASQLFQQLLDVVGSYETKPTPALQGHRLSTTILPPLQQPSPPPATQTTPTATAPSPPVAAHIRISQPNRVAQPHRVSTINIITPNRDRGSIATRR